MTFGISNTDRSTSRGNLDLATVTADKLPDQTVIQITDNTNRNLIGTTFSETQQEDSNTIGVLDQDSNQGESSRAYANPMDTHGTEYNNDSRVDTCSAVDEKLSALHMESKLTDLTLLEHRKEFIFETFEKRPRQFNRLKVT